MPATALPPASPSSPAASRRPLFGLPRLFWVLWTGALVNRLGTFVMPFLVVWLTAARGYSAERAGLVASLVGLGGLCAAPLGGVLADRLGRRAVMSGALAFGALSLLHLGWARGLVHVSLAAFLFGLINEQYRPALSAAVADLVEPSQRARAFGLTYWAANLGFAVSLPLGGYLATQGYRVLFLADAATSLFFGALVFLVVPETRPARDHSRPAAHPLAPLADGPFLLFCLLMLGVTLQFFQSMAGLPLSMTAKGLSSAQFGAVLSVNGVLIVVLQPFTDRWLVRLPRAHVMAGASLLVGLGFGATAFARGPLGYGLSIALWTLGEIALAPIGPAVVSDRAPPELRGSYQGLFQMTWGAGSFLGPLIGGQVIGRLGEDALWAGCAALGALMAAGHLWVGPRLTREGKGG